MLEQGKCFLLFFCLSEGLSVLGRLYDGKSIPEEEVASLDSEWQNVVRAYECGWDKSLLIVYGMLRRRALQILEAGLLDLDHVECVVYPVHGGDVQQEMRRMAIADALFLFEFYDDVRNLAWSHLRGVADLAGKTVDEALEFCPALADALTALEFWKMRTEGFSPATVARSAIEDVLVSL